VIDAVGGGTKLLLNNSRRWELVLNYSRAMLLASPSLHGWHLSRNLRTSLARLIALFSSSELDVRAAAHIQRCSQTPRRHGVYLRCCSLPTMDQPLLYWPLAWSPPPCWASKVSGEMISSYRKPQRRPSLTKWDLDPTWLTYGSAQISSCCHGPGPPAGCQRRGSAKGRRLSASRGSRPPTWRGGARWQIKLKRTHRNSDLLPRTAPEPTGGCQMGNHFLSS
jgi:hypothetical protein